MLLEVPFPTGPVGSNGRDPDAGIMATSHEFHHYHDFFHFLLTHCFHSSSFSTELVYLTHQDFLCCLLNIYICYFLRKKTNFKLCVCAYLWVCSYQGRCPASSLFIFKGHLLETTQWLKVSLPAEDLDLVHQAHIRHLTIANSRVSKALRHTRVPAHIWCT